MKKLSALFRRKEPDRTRDSAHVYFQGKLAAFRRLLEENNSVLASMADLEEKRSGEFLFDRAYVTTTFGALSGGVHRMIASLQSLADERYPGLVAAHAAIDERIAAALRGPRIDLAGPSVLRLSEISGETAHLAGGKMAHLGRLAADLALPVPEGFVITAAAFARFMAHAGIMGRVRERLGAVRVDALEQMEAASAEIRALIAAAEVPPELGQAIRYAVAQLASGDGGAGFAVRSSAVWEDGEFSFAGQYSSRLNVPAAEIERCYKDVVGSLFTPRAIFYYRTKGFAEEEMAMAVGVMRMVAARAAGVLYTRDPLDPVREVMVINGAWPRARASHAAEPGEPRGRGLPPRGLPHPPRHHALLPREGDGRDVRPGRGARRGRRRGGRASRRHPGGDPPARHGRRARRSREESHPRGGALGAVRGVSQGDAGDDLARAARGGCRGPARHDGAHRDHPGGRAARYSGEEPRADRRQLHELLDPPRLPLLAGRGWVGDQLNDNYIRFFFKGGGAVRDRRLRRVRLISDVLAKMDFRVQVADDVVRAVAAKYRRPDLERTLEAMGKLTAYTKQLDMAMFNDSVTNWYRDEFVREHLGS